MTTYALHRTDTGALVSVGTVIADPLPDGLASVALTEVDRDGLRSGARTWDPATRTVIATPGWVDPAVTETNRDSLRDQARNALGVNRTFIAAAKPSTAAAQASAAYDASVRHARQINRVIRLLLDEDLDAAD